MALGNVLGFATGSYSGWFTIFRFTVTSACTINCANLKSAFLLHVILLAITTYISISSIQGVTLPEEEEQQNHSEEAFLWELMGAFRYLTWPVWIVLIVTALTWIGWFPFFLFDTDWMGREIYRGKPDEGQNYHSGVRMGAFGLMLNSVVLGFSSVMLERLCKKWGSGLVWGVANIIMSLCFLAMLVISLVAKSIDYQPSGLPPDGIVVAALIVFAILGAPLAVSKMLFLHQPHCVQESCFLHLVQHASCALPSTNAVHLIPTSIFTIQSVAAFSSYPSYFYIQIVSIVWDGQAYGRRCVAQVVHWV